MLEKMKKGKRVYKVNTVHRGRGDVIFRCRCKAKGARFLECWDWEVYRMPDGRVLARNVDAGIFIEHSDGLRGLYKVLDSKCRYYKNWMASPRSEYEFDDDVEFFEDEIDEDELFDNEEESDNGNLSRLER